MQGGFQPRMFGKRMASPVQRAPFSPRMQTNFQAFQGPMGQRFQHGFRAASASPRQPQMQFGEGFRNMQPQYEEGEEVGQVPDRDSRAARASGGYARRLPVSQSGAQQRGGRSTMDLMEERLAAMDETKQMERARLAMSSELRRMHSGVSPFEHPGVYSYIDQVVTMHELPVTWSKPMCVSSKCGNVLIADQVKLAFLAEAIWEFIKRKYAEAGEVLTEKKIQEIKAQTVEFYGRQRVEAKRFLEKTGLGKGKGNK
jgi:hypothetical protein